ncbi:hypothetical protein [Rubellicoccus peritrichatus]|uniref:Methanolan biosynthesis EpsI domain-containing protein n=1 Tax=Rubellicoccus peritrichatus TaxID=3080537 RepID=A0AAQ3QTC7_9BACT|nr:hypothetical protein [Puniceicoccus sp. CR14]WOO41191.1 hypothetical protein RZN69_21430 [Puniceicoccus sp. CR14]
MLSFSTLHLTVVSILCLSCVSLYAAEETWSFPWAENYLPLSRDLSEVEIDGYMARTQKLVGGNLTIGGPLSRHWIFEPGIDASIKLSLLHSPDTNCKIYLYPSGTFAPSNTDEAFTSFAANIAKLAEKDKESEVTFIKNKEGEIEIHPPLQVNKRSAFYNPNSEEPQGKLPRICGQHYYELSYTYVHNEQKISGAAIFTYLKNHVLCISLEAPEAKFANRKKLLNQLLSSLYLENPILEAKVSDDSQLQDG